MTLNTAELKDSAATGRNWYMMLDRPARSAFWSSFAGHAADAMDTQLYSFAIPILIGLWGLTQGEAGQIASVSLVTSAIGGWGAGVLADRYGRVTTLQWTIAVFSVCSLLSALSQNFTQMFASRALLGLGFGGETAISAVLVAEMVPNAVRGRAVGLVQGGWSIGWGIAAILATICQLILPAETSWRVMFAIGASPAAIVFFLRKYVTEPAPGLKTANAKDVSIGMQSVTIFARRYLRRTVCATLMSAGLAGGFFAVMVWLPTYLKIVKGLSVVNTGAYLGFVIFGSFVGYVIGAFITDTIGRKKTLAIFAAGALLTIYIYTQIEIGASYMMYVGVPLGVFTSGIFAGLGSFLSELFPTSIRANAQGFSFNVGRAIGALFPAMIGYSSSYVSLGEAICIFSTASYLLFFITLAVLPETAGRRLADEVV
jgi:MFS family permease